MIKYLIVFFCLLLFSTPIIAFDEEHITPNDIATDKYIFSRKDVEDILISHLIARGVNLKGEIYIHIQGQYCHYISDDSFEKRAIVVEDRYEIKCGNNKEEKK